MHPGDDAHGPPLAAEATPGAGDGSPLDHATLAWVVERRDRLLDEIARVWIGPPATPRLVLAALLARGHVLLEGVPGLAKTTLASAVARAFGCDFKRIQFTPDLLPADITGTFVLQHAQASFVLRRGPLFAQVVLADEINRAPAKTQSALLEAMQERQVTIEGETHALPQPFLVLATQNPVEQEGVYPLPEAQIDRFLVRVRLQYPSPADELKMLRAHAVAPSPVRAVSDVGELMRMIAWVDAVHAEERVLSYALRLVAATRDHSRVALGASPRATLGLVRLARAQALLLGRAYATPDDVRELVAAVLEHRIVVTTDAALEGTRASDVVQDVIRQVPVAMTESTRGDLPLPERPPWAPR